MSLSMAFITFLYDVAGMTYCYLMGLILIYLADDDAPYTDAIWLGICFFLALLI